MARIDEIFLRVRDTLADPNKERWDDNRLLRLLDEAQKIIALKTKLLKSSISIPLVVGVNTYSLPPSTAQGVLVLNDAGQAIQVTFNSLPYALPSNIHIITRAVNDLGVPLKILSHTQADEKYGANWETVTGPTIEALIYDKMDQNVIKIYPTPDNSIQGDVTTQLATLNSLYGVTVSGGLESTYDLMNSPYGVVTGIAQITNTSFTIFYVRKPADITTITDNLEISKFYDPALKFYICGMALRDDKDVQNRTLGNEELQLFQDKLNDIKSDSMVDFTSVSTEAQYDVPYGKVI